jgi:hypothetical protein
MAANTIWRLVSGEWRSGLIERIDMANGSEAASSNGGCDSRGLIVPLLVLVGTLMLASFMYLQYRGAARERWACLVHDRNAHYLLGLSLALDVRQMDVRHLLSDLDGAHTWPPLHGILEAGVLLIGGIDFRLAVLPSLAGFVGTVFLGFLVARRMLLRGGDLAGLIAVIFIVSSPAHRAFATDTMLESLGGCLTLLCVYLYLVAVQDAALGAWDWLGVALTALFIHKGNYWLLVVMALSLTEFSRQPRLIYETARDWFRGFSPRAWISAQIRHPLTYVILVLGGATLYVAFHGGKRGISGEHVSIHSPHNLLHATYAVFCLRVTLWWWKSRVELAAKIGPRLRQLILFHVLPVAGWFLLPKRLGYWIWFVNPATNVGENPSHDVLGGARYYWTCFAHDYHLATWSAILAVSLAALMIFGRRNLREGGRVVLILLLLATALTVVHTNRKSRFLHSWIAVAWVTAGAGLVSAAYARRAATLPRVRPWLVGAAVGGLALAHAPGLTQAGHSPERGHTLPEPSTRDMTDYYLPIIAASKHATLLSTIEMKHTARWSVLEQIGSRDRLDVDIRNYGTTPEENRKAFDHWLATNSSDTIVFVDLRPGSYFYVPTAYNDAYGRLRGYMAEQTVFHVRERKEFPQYQCTVTIWARE